MALQAVLGPSGTVPEGTATIKGWDFCDGRDMDGVMAAMLRTGFQASALGKAIDEVNRMVRHHRDPDGTLKLLNQAL